MRWSCSETSGSTTTIDDVAFWGLTGEHQRPVLGLLPIVVVVVHVGRGQIDAGAALQRREEG